ncbi:MAG: hypothetical protein ACRDTA_29175 [Pseudonocardiaceae bacterium]
MLPARASIDELTTAVAGSDARERSEALDAWIAELDIAVALGDDVALCCAETLAHGEEWYRRWLRFAVHVRLRPQAPDVLDALRDLSANIDVFRGSPRVVVSYFAHDQIGQSLRDALAVMDDGLYPAAAEVLFTLSDTIGWPEPSRSGPFPLEKVFEALLATADTPAKREAASRLSANRLQPETRADEVYDTHASTSSSSRCSMPRQARTTWRRLPGTRAAPIWPRTVTARTSPCSRSSTHYLPWVEPILSASLLALPRRSLWPKQSLPTQTGEGLAGPSTSGPITRRRSTPLEVCSTSREKHC